MNKYFPRTKRLFVSAQSGYGVEVYGHDITFPIWKTGVTIPEYRFDREWLISHPDVDELFLWIYENIILKLNSLTYITLDVLIRISTGMLNKCCIEKDLKIQIHDQVVRKIREDFCAEMLKELPFQLQIIGLVYSSYCGQTISTRRVTR